MQPYRRPCSIPAPSLPNSSLSIALGIKRPGGWDSQPAPGSRPQAAEQPHILQITGWVEQRHWEGLW